MSNADDSERSSGTSSRRRERIDWVRILRRALRRRNILLWGLIAVAVVGSGYGLSKWWGSGGDLGAKRWTAREPVAVSKSFTYLSRPHPIGRHIIKANELFEVQNSNRLSPDWRRPHVAVYSVAAVKPPHPHPTLRDLAERGQARAIEFLARDSAAKPHIWPELLDALNDAGEPGLGEQDPFKFDRVLVATVAKGTNWDPGDRMMWTRVFVQPINFTFAGYTVAATDNATVKVTSVEATKTRKFSADLGLTLPGALEGPKADVGPSSERTVRTTSDITAQYEKLGIDIMPRFLRIIRESETGGDLVGNTTISLSVVTDPLMIHRQFPEQKVLSGVEDDLVLLVRSTKLDEVSNGKDKPSIDVLPEAPVPHCPLKARVWMLYEQRQIEAGRKFYDESRQRVRFVRDADKKIDVEIASADEVSPAVWTLKICQGQCDPDGKDRNLKAFVAPHGQKRDLIFTDYGQAVKLAHWLRYQPRGVTLNKLQFDYPLDGSPASLVPYKNTKNDCENDINVMDELGNVEVQRAASAPAMGPPRR
jgi:hypothetical protein